ncbi:MAG: hypothetical protein ACK44A_08460 [Roseateles sp.]
MTRMSTHLLPAVLVAVAAQQALGCPYPPPPSHAGPMPSMSVQPVRFVASFSARGVALDADARASLFQTLEGARRYFGGPPVCARHARAGQGLDARRLVYLSRLLALQGVPLGREQAFSCPSTAAPAQGAVDIELEIVRCY